MFSFYDGVLARFCEQPTSMARERQKPSSSAIDFVRIVDAPVFLMVNTKMRCVRKRQGGRLADFDVSC